MNRPEAFVQFQTDGAVIYLACELAQALPSDGRLRVRFPGYGDAWLRFESAAGFIAC